MDPRLVAVAGPLLGSAFILPEGEWKVGRTDENDLYLKDAAVSRDHCSFQRSGQQVVLSDMGSHNGTYVNGARIDRHTLRPGDEVRIGATRFHFTTSEGDRQEPVSSGSMKTIALRLEDSIYLSSRESGGIAPTVRAAHDMRLLLRLSTMLHSFRALYAANSKPLRDALSEHLMSLLLDLVPAHSAAVLGRSPDPATPFILLAHSLKTPAMDPAVIQQAAGEGVAILTGDREEDEPCILAAPIVVRGDVEAILYFRSDPGGSAFDDGHLQLVTAVAGMASVAWENASMMDWLRQENDRLEEELNIEHGMIGDSAKLQDLQKQIARVAPSNSTVLILGESGTGKELIARAVHRNSARRAGPFAAINCAALTDSLLESELFGYEKGAFTGAMTQRKGKLETAQGGTVFLDEIGELSPLLQAKLLRVLQERELQRVGGTQNIKLDIRLIAATNRDLADMAKKGAFRQDLYYRLNVVTLKASPLRQRPEDVLTLAEHFAKKFAQQCGRKITGISPQARSYLQSYSWPGNVRELENAMERAIVLGTSETILPEDLPENIREERPADVSVTLYEEAVEAAKRQVVLRAFDQAGYEHEQAAKLLGLHPNYLHRLIRALDIKTALKAAARAH